MDSIRKEYSPVALFVYNRVDHTRKTVEALQRNRQAEKSDIYIFSDGYKSDMDKEAVLAVRDYVKSVKGFHSVTIVNRSKNYGLAKNIIRGVTEVVEKHGRVIVLEDDVITSPGFLEYMNASLSLYKDAETVMCISGCSYLDGISNGLPPLFFIKGRGECQGWGTWKRAWKKFHKDPEKIIKDTRLLDICRYEKINRTFNQIMLNYLGKLNTWAVFWDYCIFENEGLCLCPKESLVKNIGFDGSGVHCGEGEGYYDVNKDLVDHIDFDLSRRIKYNKKMDCYYHGLERTKLPNIIKFVYGRLLWGLLYRECMKRIRSSKNN